MSDHPPPPLLRRAYQALAMACLGLAAAGAVLPVLPTTPFVIAAAWAGGKSSPALRQRLREHPRYGPALVAWQDHRAVSRRAKLAAVGLMAASWVIVWLTAGNPWVPLGVGAILCTVGTYLVTRPESGAPP